MRFIILVQVGEMSRGERHAWLQERYFFTCACPACRTVVQPDLLLSAFRCSKVGCNGVVPSPSFLELPDECVARVDSMQVRKFQHLWDSWVVVNWSSLKSLKKRQGESFFEFHLCRGIHWNQVVVYHVGCQLICNIVQTWRRLWRWSLKGALELS